MTQTSDQKDFNAKADFYVGCLKSNKAGGQTDGVSDNSSFSSAQLATNEPSKQQLQLAKSSRLIVYIFGVLLMHIVFIFAVNYFWVKPIVTGNKLTETKIQSYLYQARKVEPLLDSRVERKLSVAATLRDKPDDKLAVIKQDMARVKHAEVQEPKQELKQDVSKEPSKQVNSEPRTGLSHKIDDTAKVATPFSASSAETFKSTSVTRFTQSYLAKQRANKLDDLVLNNVNQYTQKRSLSEMDATMQELVFPEVDEYSKVVTNDHVLDPNRIIRKGDTCYRIVKIGDQINPYAETIGYPFDCGGDKVKQAINQAIDKRLEQRMIKR